MKNPPYSYWPIVDRPPVLWPGGRKMAFYIGLNIESFVPGVPSMGLGPPLSLPTDPMNRGWRDYGNRVGVWRLIDLLDELQLKPSVLLNTDVCRNFPQIIEAGAARDWAWLGHGVTNSKLWIDMERDEEARLIDGMVADLTAAGGRAPKGWLGPGLTETLDTLTLLAERGFTYSLDWVADDQPFPFEVDGHRMISIPYAIELNDLPAFLVWHWTPEQFAKAVLDQFAVLHREAQKRPGAVMCLALHPFAISTPFRHVYLERILREIRAHDDVWFPTTDDIAEHYLTNYYDAAVASVKASQRPSMSATP